MGARICDLRTCWPCWRRIPSSTRARGCVAPFCPRRSPPQQLIKTKEVIDQSRKSVKQRDTDYDDAADA